MDPVDQLVSYISAKKMRVYETREYQFGAIPLPLQRSIF